MNVKASNLTDTISRKNPGDIDVFSVNQLGNNDMPGNKKSAVYC